MSRLLLANGTLFLQNIPERVSPEADGKLFDNQEGVEALQGNPTSPSAWKTLFSSATQTTPKASTGTLTSAVGETSPTLSPSQLKSDLSATETSLAPADVDLRMKNDSEQDRVAIIQKKIQDSADAMQQLNLLPSRSLEHDALSSSVSTDHDESSSCSSSSSLASGAIILVADGLAATPRRTGSKRFHVTPRRPPVDPLDLREAATSPINSYSVAVSVQTQYSSSPSHFPYEGSLSPTPLSLHQTMSAFSSSCGELNGDTRAAELTEQLTRESRGSHKASVTSPPTSFPQQNSWSNRRRIRSSLPTFNSPSSYSQSSSTSPSSHFIPLADPSPQWRWVSSIGIESVLWVEKVPPAFVNAERFRSLLEQELRRRVRREGSKQQQSTIKFVHILQEAECLLVGRIAAASPSLKSLWPSSESTMQKDLSSSPAHLENSFSQSSPPALIFLQGSAWVQSTLNAIQGLCMSTTTDPASTEPSLIDSKSLSSSSPEYCLDLSRAAEQGLTVEDVRAFIRPYTYGRQLWETQAFDDYVLSWTVLPLHSLDAGSVRQLHDAFSGKRSHQSLNLFLVFRNQAGYFGMAQIESVTSQAASLHWCYRTLVTEEQLEFFSTGRCSNWRPDGRKALSPVNRRLAFSLLCLWRRQEKDEPKMTENNECVVDSYKVFCRAAQYAEPFIPQEPRSVSIALDQQPESAMDRSRRRKKGPWSSGRSKPSVLTLSQFLPAPETHSRCPVDKK